MSKAAKPATIEKKYEWARSVCDYLDRRYDSEIIMKLRKECRCNDGKATANKIIKYLNKTDSIESFVKAFNENETFASLEYISDNKILLS